MIQTKLNKQNKNLFFYLTSVFAPAGQGIDNDGDDEANITSGEGDQEEDGQDGEDEAEGEEVEEYHIDDLFGQKHTIIGQCLIHAFNDIVLIVTSYMYIGFNMHRGGYHILHGH